MSDKFCVDMYPPSQLHTPHPLESLVPPMDERARAIIFFRKRWPIGKTLRIRFIGGSSSDHDMVESIATEWLNHANLEFQFGVTGQSDVRIAFEQGAGSWSYLGMDALSIPQTAPTMNFGWQLEQGTILHEFGHALGLGHEHQNPAGGIEWNEQAVIDALSGPPNYWDEAKIRHNVLRKYDQTQTNGTDFDPQSVMLYFFPASWTRSGQGTEENDGLSATDQSFIATQYPGATPQLVDLPVTELTPMAADIRTAGEEDMFGFRAEQAGRFAIETIGSTDIVMRLYGPGDPAAMVAEDDDSGQNRNARIERDLAAGEYRVVVRHFSPHATGRYGIHVSRAETH